MENLDSFIRPVPDFPKPGILFRDITPLPPEPKISDEEAWKRAGRAPDGKPLDPNHMF